MRKAVFILVTLMVCVYLDVWAGESDMYPFPPAMEIIYVDIATNRTLNISFGLGVSDDRVEGLQIGILVLQIIDDWGYIYLPTAMRIYGLNACYTLLNTIRVGNHTYNDGIDYTITSIFYNSTYVVLHINIVMEKIANNNLWMGITFLDKDDFVFSMIALPLTNTSIPKLGFAPAGAFYNSHPILSAGTTGSFEPYIRSGLNFWTARTPRDPKFSICIGFSGFFYKRITISFGDNVLLHHHVPNYGYACFLWLLPREIDMVSFFRYIVDKANPVVFDGHIFIDRFVMGLWPSAIKIYWVLFVCNFVIIAYFFTLHMPRRHRRAKMIVLEEYIKSRKNINSTKPQHSHKQR